jgi:excisionase family DNA binding protein
VQVFNIREACQYLRISERSLGTEIANNKISYSRIGPSAGRVVFTLADLDEYLAARRVPKAES